MALSGRSRKNSEGLLARVNFPLYAVHLLTNRYVVVGGGGGSSRTGVANAFEVYELSHNGKRFIATEVFRHETGSEVVMNFACFNSGKRLYLVAGQESHCQLYTVTISLTKDSNSSSHLNGGVENNLRRRNVAQSSSVENNRVKNENSRKLRLDFKACDSIQTDFSREEALQRVVRVSRCGQLMATGGTDGHVRLWAFPSLRPIHDLPAHTNEIDDIDFNHNSTLVASVGKDGQTVIWCVKKGKKLVCLDWTPPNGTKYLYKRCRFGAVEEDKTSSRAYTVSNTVGRVGGSAGAALLSWNPSTGQLVRSTLLSEHVSCLCVRDDGRFLAVGTMFSGSVAIYISFSLQRVLWVEKAHGMFVTGLEFLPASSPELCSPSEASVLSISVDNKICIHDLPYRRTLPPWFVLLLIVASLLVTFILCSYLGL